MRKMRREHSTSVKTAGISLAVIVLACLVFIAGLALLTCAVKLAIG